MKSSKFLIFIVHALLIPVCLMGQKKQETFGFVDLFNGKDLSGWIAPEGEHTWKVIDGVLDYSAMGGNLVTEKEYGDYVLQLEWRFKQTTGDPYEAKIFNHDGSQKVDEFGNPVFKPIPNADSGIYVRGDPKSQVNLWCWPCGSGQLWAYHRSTDPLLRRGALPMVPADNPVGEWNQMQITLRGDAIQIVLNGKLVIDTYMPGIPDRGPIVLQHHGKFDPVTKSYSSASALIQFRNIRIKEIPREPLAEHGWVDLLENGLDDMLFKFENGTANKGTYKIKDDILEISGEPAGYMYTKKSYRNYILEAELAFERPEGLTYFQDFRGNSGILAHITPGEGIKVWPRSIEVQGYNMQMARILLIPRDLDSEYVSDFDAIDRVRKPIGQFNKIRYETIDGKMKIYLNGTLISFMSRSELTEGPIGFQSEGAACRWRNIRIKEM